MRPRHAFALSLLFALAAPAAAQKPAVPTSPTKPAAAPSARSSGSAAAQRRPWYQDAVFYEIYPRSYGDANGDGIGDLKGITEHLDYLKELGIDAIWITPCFPSPQVDFGYDVSDYQAIAPEYGTLADYDRLEAEAKKRGIRIIFDFVVNHTSDRHPWFVEARSSRTSPKRDWYVWRDGKRAANGQLEPPNNWNSGFGGSAWQWDPKTSQYYYHFFYVQQPDLNWRNPAVEQAMLDVTRWWYRRGISGFRLDAVDRLYEDPQLRDNPLLPGTNAFGQRNEDELYDRNLPEVHDAMRALRKVADAHDAVLIGETWTTDVAQLKGYYGQHDDEINMPMDLMFIGLGGIPGTNRQRLDARVFRAHVAAMEAAGEWPVYVVGNHDTRRVATRFDDGRHRDQIAKAIGALQLTLRGTPILYYGEELGMTNNDPTRREDVRDPIGRRGWPKEIGRDGERTPMQWTSGPNAGFSTGATGAAVAPAKAPWLPVPASAATHNVASESRDPASVLGLYRAVLQLRRREPALRAGSYAALDTANADVMSYLRRRGDDAVLVAINMSAQPRTVAFDLAAQGLAGARATPLVASAASGSLAAVKLQPYGVWIARVAKP